MKKASPKDDREPAGTRTMLLTQTWSVVSGSVSFAASAQAGMSTALGPASVMTFSLDRGRRVVGAVDGDGDVLGVEAP